MESPDPVLILIAEPPLPCRCSQLLSGKFPSAFPSLFIIDNRAQPIGVVAASLIAYGLIPSFSCESTLPACDTGSTPCCTEMSNRGW